MEQLILTAKAFTEPARVRILAALRNQELCVCELCDALGMTQSTLSTHLQVIRKTELVSARKQGKWMYYALSNRGAPLVRLFFKAFADSLQKDARLKVDSRKLEHRLSQREGDMCCIGFGSADRRHRGGRK